MKTPVLIAAALGIVLVGQDLGSPARAQPQSEPDAAREADQDRLNELMNLMAEEMAALSQTEGRQERENLMATHRDHMREAMALMSGMGGETMGRMLDHMTGSGRTGSARPERRHVHRPPVARRSELSDSMRLNDLELRVDMMQLMMESLLEQSATEN